MSDFSHRRMHPRVEMILKVEYLDQGEFLAEYTRDLSEGGIFIATDRHFKLGDKLVFEISFPGLLSPIRCRGEIRWRRPPEMATEELPPGIGVAFLFSNSEEWQKIRSLVEKVKPAPHEEQRDPESNGAYRVLLVEDNHMVREMFRFAVKKFHRKWPRGRRDVTVVEAGTGKEALEHLRGEAFDLAIIDYYLPVMNGGQLIRQMRSEQRLRSLPVVVVSAGGEEIRKESYLAGADLYIQKPVLLDRLFSSFEVLLNDNGRK